MSTLSDYSPDDLLVSQKRRKDYRTYEMTDRRIEVLVLVADGLRDAEIAGRLGVTVKTAVSHVHTISRILGARNRAHAVALAFQLGILKVRNEK